MVIAIDGRRAGCVSILPYAETMVDKGMMHPEDRVAGTSRNIRHNGANTIVSISMRTIDDLLLRVSLLLRDQTYPPSAQLSISEYELRELHVLTKPVLHCAVKDSSTARERQ